MGIVTMKELLEAGVHFGHQTRRWDPRMKPYIFTERNGIHIIDLQKTIAQLKIAYNAIKELSKQNGIILFVGTKRQSQSAIAEEAMRCGMPYVAKRWLGGMLTNFSTIQKSTMRLKKLERMEVDGSFEYMTKKEVIKLNREKEKLLKNIGGVKDMESLPDIVFVIDPKKEAIAVAEAIRLKIPIVAIVDTNCNPDGIIYPIPGNDDAIRAINLFAAIISSAVIEGQNEAGKIEITEETKIISLEEEEKARAEREERYISDEDEEIFVGDEKIEEPAGREEGVTSTWSDDSSEPVKDAPHPQDLEASPSEVTGGPERLPEQSEQSKELQEQEAETATGTEEKEEIKEPLSESEGTEAETEKGTEAETETGTEEKEEVKEPLSESEGTDEKEDE